MTQRRRPFASLALFLLAAGLPGCGSDSSPTAAPTPVPTPVPRVQTVVASGSGSVPARVLVLVPFTTAASGTIDVAVDWTFATNDIHVYLISGPCESVDQFNARQCTVSAFSESTLLKPERIALAGAMAGTYTLGIGNVGPGDESASFQAVLTTGGLRGQ